MKSFSYLLLTLLIIVCNVELIKASNPNAKTIVVGKLIDAANSKPIEFASVAIFSQKDSTLVNGSLTTNDGSFELTVSKSGTYYLQANFMGYETLYVPDIVINGEPRKNIGVLKMSESRTELDEVVVSAKKNHIDYKIDRKVINISTDIAADGGSAADALENVPSVEVDIDGNVTLRGNSNFQVLIDGKPSAMDASEILKQTPAAMIENIEIITNPSAKYDPEGETGIINLVTKKNIVQGVNGVVNLSVGSQHRYGGDFLLNLRRQKINYFVGGHYDNRGNQFNGISNRITYQDQFDNYVNQINKNEIEFKHGGLKMGLDYYATERDIISFSIEGGMAHFDYTGTNNYDNWTQNIGSDQQLNRETVKSLNDNSGPSNYFNASLSYQRNFQRQGHKLNFNSFVSFNDNDDDNQFDQYISNVNSGTDPIHKGHHIDNVRDNARARANLDYTLPFANEQKFEAGVQADYIGTDTDYDYLDLIDNNYVINDIFTNDVDFDRFITSVYATYSTHWLGLGFQFGLRGEHTHRTIETPNQDYSINRFDLFPTLHISRAFGEHNSLQIGYSRRIRRPWDRMLNPYPMYSDEYSRSMGNPELKPVYTDAVELNYQISYNKWFFAIETFYRYTDGQTQQVSHLEEDDILVSRPENLSTNNDLGAGFTLNIDPVKWFTSNTNIEMQQYYVKGNYDGQDLSRDGKSWRLRQQFTFQPAKNTKIQVNLRYRGSNKTLISSDKGSFITGLSLRQSFLNKRLSLSFNIRDIFKTQNMKSTTETDTYWLYTERTRKAPSWNIGLNYKINNFKDKLPEGMDGGGSGGDDFGGGDF